MRADEDPEAHIPLTPEAVEVEWRPADLLRRAGAGEIFPTEAPLELDLGCGEGNFLIGQAQRYPGHHFVATERLLGRVRQVCRKVAYYGLKNVRVLRLDSVVVVRHLLPLRSVAIAHVLFPDPWPKRYHHDRRLIQDGFLQDLRPVMRAGGELRIKTDDLPYYQWIEAVLAGAAGWERVEWVPEEGYPVTNFERRFVLQGLPIHRARMVCRD